MNTILFATLWAQQGGGGGAGGELVKLLIALLILVGPVFFRYLQEQSAKKDQKRLNGREMEKKLHDIFVSSTNDEEPVVPAKPKKERKRKRQETVAAGIVVEKEPASPTNLALSRQLSPQGEGSRFDAKPGTFDGATLTPTVEPTVQPMLDSLTGIYDAQPSSSTTSQTPLAVELFQMLSTPSGVRQAVILGEILKRPEY